MCQCHEMCSNAKGADIEKIIHEQWKVFIPLTRNHKSSMSKLEMIPQIVTDDLLKSKIWTYIKGRYSNQITYLSHGFPLPWCNIFHFVNIITINHFKNLIYKFIELWIHLSEFSQGRQGIIRLINSYNLWLKSFAFQDILQPQGSVEATFLFLRK